MKFSRPGFALTVFTALLIVAPSLLAQATPQGTTPACQEDEDCDDGLFCTGLEQCVDGSCVAVSACPPAINGCVQVGAICDEETDTCLDKPDDSLCDNGLFCDGQEFCDPNTGQCQPGLICPAAIEGCKVYGSCDEELDECTFELDDELCQKGESCNPAGVCVEVLPLYLFTAGTPCSACSEEEEQFDGIALTNLGASEANVTLELFLPPSGENSSSGLLPQGSHLARLLLPSGEQVARLRSDLFQSNSKEPGWIELSGDTGSLGTFFQFGTGFLSQLDGGVAIAEKSTRFTFTRVFDGPGSFRGRDAATGISIFNPNQDPVTVRLTYLFPAAGQAAQSVLEALIEIPARTMSLGLPSEIFGAPLSGGAIAAEVTEGDGVVAFELVQLIDQTTVMGLNAATFNTGTVAYSAQLASQPGLFTSVNVVNRGDGPRNLTFRAIGEDGSSLAEPVERLLQPDETFTADAAVLFGSGAAGTASTAPLPLVGSLIVEADGDGVVGDVLFGDSDHFEYAASLPLQTQTFQEALFNQVANVSGFFTGLAFFYPGPSRQSSQGVPNAEITIQVFLPDGTLAGESVQRLAAGERFSRLVSQLVEEAVDLAGGYVRIFSTRPIIGQMLFGVVGPRGIQLFSAVPPTVIL